ncbi:hypothetical protein B0H13DRAFT_1853167 [Mycena leptocephala]|nr:hypothetical protein B0H13DRAFT_1853167 [Mycena leptocephala]
MPIVFFNGRKSNKIPTEHKPIPGGRSHKTLTDWDWLALEWAGPLDTTLWDLTTSGVRKCTGGVPCLPECCRMAVADHPPEIAAADEKIVISSETEQKRDLNLTASRESPRRRLKASGNSRAARPARCSSANAVFKKLLEIPALKDKYLVTKIIACHAYSMYLSRKFEDTVSLALLAKTPIPVAPLVSVGGELGGSWWSETGAGVFRHGFTPLFALKRIRKPGFLSRGPPPEDIIWEDAEKPWWPLDEDGEEETFEDTGFIYCTELATVKFARRPAQYEGFCQFGFALEGFGNICEQEMYGTFYQRTRERIKVENRLGNLSIEREREIGFPAACSAASTPFIPSNTVDALRDIVHTLELRRGQELRERRVRYAVDERNGENAHGVVQKVEQERVPGAHEAGAVARAALESSFSSVHRSCHAARMSSRCDRLGVQRPQQRRKKRVCGALEICEIALAGTRHPEKVDRAFKWGVERLTREAGVPQLYGAFGEEQLVTY